MRQYLGFIRSRGVKEVLPLLVAPLLLYGYLDFIVASCFFVPSLLIYLAFLHQRLKNYNRYTKLLDCSQFAYELFKNLRDGYILEESYFVASYALRRNFNVMSLARFKLEHSFLFKWGMERYRSSLEEVLSLDPKMCLNQSRYQATSSLIRHEFHRLLSREKMVARVKNFYLDTYFLVSLVLILNLFMSSLFPAVNALGLRQMLIFGLVNLIEILLLYLRIYLDELV